MGRQPVSLEAHLVDALVRVGIYADALQRIVQLGSRPGASGDDHSDVCVTKAEEALERGKQLPAPRLLFSDVVDQAYAHAQAKGFWAAKSGWPFEAQVGIELALIGREASEALEELRRYDCVIEKLATEVGDAVIRGCNLLGFLAVTTGINPEEIVAGKLAYNWTRPAMHGGKRF